MYQLKKMLAGLGMKYEKIDSCSNNCMLFWKENADLTRCLFCKKSRYIEVTNTNGELVKTKVVEKQLCYMSLTPKLK